jgi:hypothetical protein
MGEFLWLGIYSKLLSSYWNRSQSRASTASNASQWEKNNSSRPIKMLRIEMNSGVIVRIDPLQAEHGRNNSC